MNIELIISIGGASFSVIGGAITIGVMLRSYKQDYHALQTANKNGFETLQASSKAGFEMVDLKLSNYIQVVNLERDGMKKDITSLEEECEGLKESLKGEVYPRLNTIERNIEKNCRAVIDHKELCSERHRKGA